MNHFIMNHFKISLRAETRIRRPLVSMPAMDPLHAPDWLSATLTVLTAASFTPQLRRIWSRSSSTDISIIRLLMTLILATEHFTFFFFLLFNHPRDIDQFVHSPLTTSDWLNFTHVTVVWMCFLVLFVSALYHIPPQRDCTIILGGIAYVLFLISVIPQFLDATTDLFGRESKGYGRDFLLVMFGMLHAVYIHPAIVIISIISVLLQMYKAAHPWDGVVSSWGLALQAIVFAVTGVSWFGRISFGDEERDFPTWYAFLGWPTVDYLVLATMQATVLGIAVCCRRKTAGSGVVEDGEVSEPLLGEVLLLGGRED
ncbi:hypothetical protein BDV06DRAFT_188211 [Aspergillus oleicola]